MKLIKKIKKQYIGFKDKDGNSLFVGDIFHIGDINIRYVVELTNRGYMGRQVTNTSRIGLFYHEKFIVKIKNSL